MPLWFEESTPISVHTGGKLALKVTRAFGPFQAEAGCSHPTRRHPRHYALGMLMIPLFVAGFPPSVRLKMIHEDLPLSLAESRVRAKKNGVHHTTQHTISVITSPPQHKAHLTLRQPRSIHSTRSLSSTSHPRSYRSKTTRRPAPTPLRPLHTGTSGLRHPARTRSPASTLARKNRARTPDASQPEQILTKPPHASTPGVVAS